MGGIADWRLIRRPDRTALHDTPETRQTFAERQFEKHFAVFVKQIEREECDRRIAKQCLRYFASPEAGLNDCERQDAIAERDDFAIENDAAIELQRRRRDLGKPMRNVVERARIDADFVSFAVDLRAD